MAGSFRAPGGPIVSERFEIGQRVTWLRSQQQAGLSRFDESIAGIVREVTTMRVRIEVAMHGRLGGWVRVIRDVRPERLRPLEGACAELGEEADD
jgi:hypothetical protein